MKKQEGYTLVEMVIAIAVGLVVILVIYAAVNVGQRSAVNVERKVAAHQDARAALQLMSLEIQMASYDPVNPAGIWRNPTACSSPSANQNYRGIQTATATALTIEMDANDNGVVGGGDPNEIITYSYDAANQYITRETSCGGGQPFLGDMPGDPRAVRVINTAAVPVFRYFDPLGIEILPAGLPVGIPNIARIDITLWVETEEIDPNTNQRRKTVYSTSVIPRNHRI
ncbi:MAG: prepilin-type N-terminal cleavage/methylation domain-containing protein [Deltaproteobacteria bacterium]|nr:prepilin-type N-terminal cleavage/methylation domain-containing protein [Deltaproteobacteria bacterium]